MNLTDREIVHWVLAATACCIAGFVFYSLGWIATVILFLFGWANCYQAMVMRYRRHASHEGKS